MGKVVVAGGTGFVGTEVVALLIRLGHDVVVLSRGKQGPHGSRTVNWNGELSGPWTTELDGALAVINLTGEPIVSKWTKEAKDAIINSRVRSTEAIGKAISACSAPPQVWVNASAIGYYGDRGSEELTESSQPGPRRDFLVDTCVAWEAAVDRTPTPTTRKTIVRLGLVLGRKGGALPQLLKITQWFLGGQVGPGDQYVSWIHIKDLARLIVFAIDHEGPKVLNGTAPDPSTNRFFMAVIRGVVGRPWAFPIPAFFLRIANWFGAPEPRLLLDSQRVFPKAALDAGFKFEFDDLRDALRELA